MTKEQLQQIAHNHQEAIERWLKHHPLKATFCIILFVFIGFFMSLFTYGLPVFMGLFFLYFVYTMFVMVLDMQYKSRTGWFEKHRCKECGHFVAPKDEEEE